MYHLHKFVSQALVIIAISMLLFSISSLIKFSLCLRDFALSVDTLIVWAIPSVLMSTVGT